MSPWYTPISALHTISLIMNDMNVRSTVMSHHVNAPERIRQGLGMWFAPREPTPMVLESPRRLDKTHKARHFPSVNTALEPFASAYASENRMMMKHHSSVRSGG